MNSLTLALLSTLPGEQQGCGWDERLHCENLGRRRCFSVKRDEIRVYRAFVPTSLCESTAAIALFKLLV